MRQIARQIILITFRSIECILSRGQPIHVVIGVRRRLVLRIGHGQEIAVGIVAELGHTIAGVGGIDRLLPQESDEAPQAPWRVPWV